VPVQVRTVHQKRALETATVDVGATVSLAGYPYDGNGLGRAQRVDDGVER